ncbi:MarR family winged helix-turn-helix transcriptional regulator [Pseudalkalibacillus decolorationis]|uniref:MarR family winged helix-turn-helix transcriptional regulator n=1 Tax=Pseudalkalibacillus decolorationis TaxID=163879 RepID=UPI00214798CE|nr:MarR family transcriptional regulator [Pseudalkalibacillus decolorationis]
MNGREKLILEFEQSFRWLLRSHRKAMANVFDKEITSSEFMFLYYLNEHGPKKVSLLADEFQVNRSHVSNVMERLYSRDLVDRIRSSADRRVVEMIITSDGSALLNEMKQKRAVYFQQQFELFKDEEIEQMVLFFNKIQEKNSHSQ